MFLNTSSVFGGIDQARDSVKSVANGFHGQLRLPCPTDHAITRRRLLAQCRETPAEVRLFEVPLAQQIKGLHDNL